MKKCSILVNGFYTNPSIEHQVRSLSGELLLLGVASEVVKSDTVPAYIEGDRSVCGIGESDFVIYLDKDIHTAFMLEKGGFTLFNSARAIALCDDKTLTYTALLHSGVRMPRTVSSPVMYRPAEDGAFLDAVEEKIGYPAVVKESYGSMGYGVHLARDRAELEAIRGALRLKPHLYQQFVGKGGEDTRVIVIGGKAIAAMRRVNENDFRSNLEHGGKGYPAELNEEEKAVAERAAAELGLDYGGIDLLRSTDGEVVFCEANSNAFWSGFERATGVNVAALYARHVVRKIYGSSIF